MVATAPATRPMPSQPDRTPRKALSMREDDEVRVAARQMSEGEIRIAEPHYEALGGGMPRVASPTIDLFSAELQ